jgi:hypothetical protein
VRRVNQGEEWVDWPKALRTTFMAALMSFQLGTFLSKSMLRRRRLWGCCFLASLTIIRANIAVVADGGSLLEAAIAALAALINSRAWLTSSDKAPPFCAGEVLLDCTTWSFRIGPGEPSAGPAA